jgi:hypothetical protein
MALIVYMYCLRHVYDHAGTSLRPSHRVLAITYSPEQWNKEILFIGLTAKQRNLAHQNSGTQKKFDEIPHSINKIYCLQTILQKNYEHFSWTLIYYTNVPICYGIKIFDK